MGLLKRKDIKHNESEKTLTPILSTRGTVAGGDTVTVLRARGRGGGARGCCAGSHHCGKGLSFVGRRIARGGCSLWGWTDGDMNRDRVKEFVLGLAFLALGLCVAIPATLGAVDAYKKRAAYRQTTCVLLEKRLKAPAARAPKKPAAPGAPGDFAKGEDVSPESAEARENARRAVRAYEAWTKISYTLDGVEREAEGDLFPPDDAMGRRSVGRILQQMKVGETYPCWVDPGDPSKVLLSLGSDGPWSFTVMIGGGLLFVVVGVKFVVEAARGKTPPSAPGLLDDVQPI